MIKICHEIMVRYVGLVSFIVLPLGHSAQPTRISDDRDGPTLVSAKRG